MAIKTAKKKKKPSKSKVTTKDFLKLLEQQDQLAEKTAFRPKRGPRSGLRPVPKKLLEVALVKAPTAILNRALSAVSWLRRTT